ncbi:helix-turn-helix transcriptional regulator [Rhodococcus sp. APC 3903]|uniref:helix-turn-helix domain-containing protein n=1 Tax=Rhodococcus sp. APC 3903 TaxID=3035193 RepID=UPI0025B622F8|nr:helix-turn-helix transcriptional regulator [Rhodococcus sp. APC 3903]MDN3459865.1 helix-turn-helix transcriptional regulator [Rhodococcus sp. APC 3903]
MDIYDFRANDCGDTFQVRLNELFAAAGRRLTNREVAAAIRTHGCQISEVYVSQLRAGARRNPSEQVLSALAAYFEVPQDFFFATRWSSGGVQAHDHDAALVDSLSTSRLKRFLTLAVGLSGRNLRLLETVAVELSDAERRRDETRCD